MAKINWEQSFKKDIKNKMNESKKEFDLYKKTDYVIYLQQSGNKLFSAVENYLMLKNHKRVRNYHNLLKMVMSNKNDKELLTQAVQLHYFFYNGDLHMDRYTAEEIYKIVYDKMKNRMRLIY